MHCLNCLPAVTHTKLGVCLIFKYNMMTTLTVDLIMVFKVLAKSTLGLFDKVFKTLIEKQPPNWLPYFNGVIKRDTILPDAFNEQRQTDTEEELDIAIKILNYGPDSNYIVRPKQELALEDFETFESLKDVYVRIKGKIAVP